MRTGSTWTPHWAWIGAALSILGCTTANPQYLAQNTEAGGEEAASLGSDESETDVGSSDDESTSDEAEATDTDTDESDETDTGAPECQAPTNYIDCDVAGLQLSDKPELAFGLNCNGPLDSTIHSDGLVAFSAEDPTSYRVAKTFGVAPGPNHGGKLWAANESAVSGGDGFPDIPANTSASILILSTGYLPEADNMGAVLVEEPQFNHEDNDNPDWSGDNPYPPAPITPDKGSNFGAGGTPFKDCDGIGDCSESLYNLWVEVDEDELVVDQFYDQLWMQFTVTPPPGVHGFLFDFAYFSSEYPESIGTQYVDMFVVWVASEGYTGNLTFVDDLPLSSNSLTDAGGFDFLPENPALDWTGFEENAGTGWRLARGPATPGVPMELTFFLADGTEPIAGSVVLLDNFRWICEGCEGDGCGFTP